MSRDERRLSAIPGWLWGALAAGLSLQLAWHAGHTPRAGARTELAPAPSAPALRIASFGEAEAAARLAMLYVQSRNHRDLDYGRLIGWLEAILELDPRSVYPLFAAARVFAENPDAARSRAALEFVYRAFLRDPNRRWPALAHAALLAKHRLGELPLARRYAAAIERHTSARDVPSWARQMEIFILEDMDQLQAARTLLAALLASGEVRDPAEVRFLAERLEALEERMGGAR